MSPPGSPTGIGNDLGDHEGIVAWPRAALDGFHHGPLSLEKGE